MRVSSRSGPEHRCLGGVAGTQLVVPAAVAAGGDGTDLSIAHLAHVQPAGDHVTVGCVLRLDVLGVDGERLRATAEAVRVCGAMAIPSWASRSAFVLSSTRYEAPRGPDIARLSHFGRTARWVTCTIARAAAYSRPCS